MKLPSLLLVLSLTSGLCLSVLAGEPSQERTLPPRRGELAPIGSLVFTDLEGEPRSLSRAWGDAKWVVVHVFDTSDMELLPATQTYDPEDVRRAEREGGALDPERAPRTWNLNDYFEQAHARFTREKGFRWIGIRAEDFSMKAVADELERRRDGAEPEHERLSGSEANLLELHLKRRTKFAEVLVAPTALELSRLGVKSTPAILLFDRKGQLLFSWQELAKSDTTNHLLRKIYELRKAERAEARAAN